MLFYESWHAYLVSGLMVLGSAWIARTAYEKWSQAENQLVFEEPALTSRS